MKCILIHGLGQSSSDWDNTISYLDNRYIFENPSIVELLKGKEYTYDSLYGEFYKYCQQFEEPLHLCGLSLGAVMSLNYALDQGDKVHSLILIGGQYKTPKALIKLQNIIFRVLPKSIFRKIGFEKKDFLKLTNSFSAIDFTNKIVNIKCDTLILCGEKDRANIRASKELANLIPKARLKIIKGAGHEMNLECPDKLADIIKEFYRKQ